MLRDLALLIFAMSSSGLAELPSLPIATDKELSTDVRLIETADEVRFEFTGPSHVLPSVSIDVNRNGIVDRNLDFRLSLGTNGSACLQYLLRENASSICEQPGEKAKVLIQGDKDQETTILSFPKSEISGDGFGFGFAISLWNKTGNYETSLAGGDYRFGGTLNLVSEGPNFVGNEKPDLPAPIMPAVHRYEGCLHKSLDMLAPLDQTMGAKIKAVPANCATERETALNEGVEALVASGIEKDEATKAMLDALEGLDSGVARFAEVVEKGG
jgi:hypothetical protein